MINMKELAAEIKIPYHQIQYLVANGRIKPSRKAGRMYLFDASVVQKLKLAAKDGYLGGEFLFNAKQAKERQNNQVCDGWDEL